ncbi:MAG: DnaD domain protein [Synergistaceae bacterium]|nr:DnaD domain protein [Synergistaceae bacterium]
MTRAEKNSLLSWRSKFRERASPDPDAVVRQAVTIAAVSDKRNARYVAGILKRWFAAGLVSTAQIEAAEVQYQESKNRPASRAAPGPDTTNPFIKLWFELDEKERKERETVDGEGCGDADGFAQSPLSGFLPPPNG